VSGCGIEVGIGVLACGGSGGAGDAGVGDESESVVIGVLIASGVQEGGSVGTPGRAVTVGGGVQVGQRVGISRAPPQAAMSDVRTTSAKETARTNGPDRLLLSCFMIHLRGDRQSSAQDRQPDVP
jgi:hypothetical protein